MADQPGHSSHDLVGMATHHQTIPHSQMIGSVTIR